MADPKRMCPECGKPMTLLFNVFECVRCDDERKRRALEREKRDCDCGGECDKGDDCCKNRPKPDKDGCGGCKKGGCGR